MNTNIRTRVKICGITRVEDALCAVNAGVDAIGLVFYAPSPRHISIKQAQEIIAAMPPFITIVGLFVNAPRLEIEHILTHVNLDILQFHGDETVGDCEQFGMSYIKVIRVKADTNLLQCQHEYASSKALLLDTYSDAAYGGTGHAFDWDLIPKNMQKPLILAGGLHAANVGLAIKKVQPYAVDVSGGVELAKGIKDAGKIAEFIQATFVN